MKWNLLLILWLGIVFSCEKNDPPKPPVEKDPKPIFSFSDINVVEGDDQLIEVQVVLEGKHTEPLKISYKTIFNTAEPSNDYLEVDEILEFSSSETKETKSFYIEIIDDDIYEVIETFDIVFHGDTSVVVEDSLLTITINDNDIEYTDNELAGYVTLRNKEGWNLIWADEFEGNEVNLNNWTEENRGNWYNNELQYYKPENTVVGDGLLTINAIEEEIGGHHYSSSRLLTKHKAHYQYGWIDIRAKLPYSKGLWPALWMMGENIDEVSWPACGEIDIMELRGHIPNTISSTVHYKNSSGNHQNPPAKKKVSLVDYSDEFHVFSMYWNKYRVDLYVDDVKYNTIFFSSLNFYNDENPFTKEFFILMNVAVGGDFGGNPNATTVWPQKMEVDYVRVYQEE